MSYDTRLLVEKLSSVKEGETVSYDDLDKAIGRDVRNGAYCLLLSARRIVRRDSGIVFETIRNVGLKRSDNAGIVNNIISTTPRKIRSLIGQQAKNLACVNGENLEEPIRIKRDMSLAFLGMVDLMTKPSKLEKLEAKIAESPQHKLPTNEMLALFKT